MKKLIQISAVVLLPFLCFAVISGITYKKEEVNLTPSGAYVSSPSPPAPVSFKNEFVNIIFNKGYTYDNIFVTHRLDRIWDSLHFNASQNYFYQDAYYGNILGYPLTPDQISRMDSLMTLVSSTGIKGIYNRNKIADAIINSQRVIYEVSSSGSTIVNNGFCWQYVDNSVGSYVTDSSRTVLKCITGLNNAGVLCNRIYENLQHSDKLGTWGWSDTRFDWHLKPVMRIDSSVFSLNNTTPVVRIVKINFDGDSMNDTVIIRVNNFRDSVTYGGQYKEMYKFLGFIDSLQFYADTISGLNKGWENVMNSNNMIEKTCKVDFEIYWYGLVDVWFDQLIVDNDMADKLFNGQYDDDVEEEVTEFWKNAGGKNYFFFVDEMSVSNVSSAKYVFDLAKNVPGAGNVRISYALTNYFNERGIRQEYINKMEIFFQ